MQRDAAEEGWEMGLIDRLIALADRSYEEWDSEGWPDDEEYQGLVAECNDAWEAAIAAAAEGDLAVAAEWLRTAARCERDGGDSSTAQAGLRLVEEVGQ